MPTASSAPVTEINRQFSEREVAAKAASLGLPYRNFAQTLPVLDGLSLMSKPEAESAQALPFSRQGKVLFLAVVDPENSKTKALINRLNSPTLKVQLLLVSSTSFLEALPQFDSDLVNRKQLELKSHFEENDLVNTEKTQLKFQELERLLGQVTAQEALNEIQILALQTRASDIHLQPYEAQAILRFRLDGLLHDIATIDRKPAQKLVDHIKYAAGMKSNIKHIPQDGHLDFLANGRRVDLRISTLPTPFFESVVLRVLDSARGLKDFESLGFEAELSDQIRTAISHKNGLVLVTGPTGSGKTTTLYSMLSELNLPDKKIVTLEDPIEYHLDNITQSQVDEKSDYQFSNGLRALLRHDPDVILVGEIRDYQTAKLAIEASLTGHVVFSSLHTNSAIGAITRMKNLGIESFNIATSFNAIFAQRLVRKLCPNCAQSETIDLANHPSVAASLERLKVSHPELHNQATKDGKTITVPKAVGCPNCSQTGFKGQTVLCEALILDEAIRNLINESHNELQIRQWINEHQPKFLSLFEDGVRQALLGYTSLAEVYRVAG